MAVLYHRQIEVRVAGLVISAPKIAFDIKREVGEFTTEGHILIYNLKREHEQQIEEKGTPLSLQAGYPQTKALIFDGAVSEVTREREGLSRITRIELTSAVTSAKRLRGTTNRTWEGKEPIRSIITDLVSDLGLTLGPLTAVPKELVIENFKCSTVTQACLSVVCRSAGIVWYEDDGIIKFSQPGKAQQGARTLVLSPKTGLLSSPSKTEKGAECKSFLNPLARIEDLVRLESESLSGTWKIAGFKHSGDNWTDNFTTFYELRPFTSPTTASF